MKLKYFLDHPQIKRHKSPGNGNTPGSIADQINFGGKAPKPQPTSQPTTQPSSGGIMSAIKGVFKK